MKKKVFLFLLSALLLITGVLAPAATVAAVEDITANPMTFNLNINTTDLSGGDAGNSNTAHATMQKGQYLQYTVNTEHSAIYKLTLYGSIVTDNATMTISVNGTAQLDAVSVANTGGHGNRDPHVLGNITLAAGANVIRFQVKNSASVCTKFTLEKVQDVYFFDVKQANFTEDEYYVSQWHATSGWWSGGSYMIMRGGKITGDDDDTWIQKTINVTESGWYGVSMVYGTSETGTIMQVAVDGEVKTNQTMISTGSYTKKNTQQIGCVYLEAGTRTVRIIADYAAAFVYSFTIGAPQDEIVDGTWGQKITPASIYSHSGYSEGDVDLSYAHCVNLRGSKTFTLLLYTEKSYTYELIGKYGTSSGKETIGVSVNGNKQIAAAPLDLTGNYTITDGHHIGYITLNRGANEITFSIGEGGSGAIVMGGVTLNLADSFQNNEWVGRVQKGTVPEAYFSGGNAGWYTASGVKCATLRANSYVLFDIYTEEERLVNVTLEMATPESITGSVYVNDEAVIASEVFSAFGTNYSTFSSKTSTAIITIPAGHSTIKYLQNKGASNMKSITLEDATINEAYILDFALENKDGGRMVYASRDSLKAYASVTVRKLGEADDMYRLVTAQYNGKQLVAVKDTLIDVSKLAHKETKTIRSELTLKGEGTTVKGFLFDYSTFAPLAEAQVYGSADIFPDDVLDTVVNHQLATETLNNDGVYYAEYGVHDDKYDIDAIFYDGYNNTKVYAYIGIPKNASASNKVPAMVLVHGGVGRAEISWVKKWNDLGVAAIAMDLYGGGPEIDESTSNKRKVHPYAGITPWGNTAFLEDFENAGMYQTVISVINAHNLLRQNENVDNDRIGITGISWGGVTTTTTIGVDDRFMFAAPVYGCGYLDQCQTGFGSSYVGAGKTILWDPANFAAKSKMPVLYVNGDEDAHFSINATSDSACVTEDATISIHHSMAHSQSAGDSVQQVYRYAQNMFSGNNTNMKITDSTAENGVLTAEYTLPSGTTISNVKMYYITTDYLTYGGGSAIGWKLVDTYTDDGNTISVNIPQDATYCYASITDNYGDIISTKFMKVK